MGTIEEGGGHRICFYTDPPHRTGLWKFSKKGKWKKEGRGGKKKKNLGEKTENNYNTNDINNVNRSIAWKCRQIPTISYIYHLYSLCIRSEIQLFNRIIISAIHHTLDMNLRLRYFIQVGTCCTAREEPSQQSALSSKCNTCFFGPVSTFLVVIICCSIFIVSQVSRGHYQARAILYFGPIYV